MREAFLFDIDGTVTENKHPASPEMVSFLNDLGHSFDIYYVTGDTFTNTKDVLNGAEGKGIFCNYSDELRDMNGNSLAKEISIPPIDREIETYLYQKLEQLECCHFGNRIEWRSPRCVNFCPVGRNIAYSERKKYPWVSRQETVDEIKVFFPEVSVSMGGSVSIDIYANGADKSRAAEYINSVCQQSFIYIGDKVKPLGNDWPVKLYCERNPLNVCLSTKDVSTTMFNIKSFLEFFR